MMMSGIDILRQPQRTWDKSKRMMMTIGSSCLNAVYIPLHAGNAGALGHAVTHGHAYAREPRAQLSQRPRGVPQRHLKLHQPALRRHTAIERTPQRRRVDVAASNDDYNSEYK